MVISNRYAALAGVASAAVALGVGELVALIVSARSGPLVAVGGTVIDKVPESGKELAISLFGTYDKLALQIGTILLLIAFAAAVGVVANRRLWLGFAGIGLFGVVGVLAALTRTGADATWAIPTLVATAAAAGTLYAFLRTEFLLGAGYALSRRPTSEAPTSEAPTSEAPTSEALTSKAPTPGPVPMGQADRRRFLGAAGIAIGGAAVLGYVGRTLGENSSVNDARAALSLPPPSGVKAIAPQGADVQDLRYITPNDDFYRIDTAIVTPRIDPKDWTLRIKGRVGRPMTLTFDDLLKRPMVERYVTLSCVSNEVGGDLVGNALWLGVPVADLLREAQPDPGADQVVSRSVDGFTAGTPTKALLDGRDALIAVGMNSEPLPINHGFPARLVVPGLYGYVSATKWLAELELTTFAAFDAYWVPRGWAQQAPIKTQSRIDKPRPGTIPPGQTVIAGVAWAPHRGISKVEVQVDGGPWQTATLASVASIDTWRLWSLPWNATPGDHVLRVRATDNAGDTQTEAMTEPAPDGATGWHTIGVTVR